MKNSKIEWTDHTFNPWIGCTKISPGCANCYAETRDQRFAAGIHWGKGAPRERTSDDNWREPIRWNKIAGAGHFVEVTRAGKFIARGDMRVLAKAKVAGAWLIQKNDRVIKVRPRVFCASLADWLDDEVSVQWLADLLRVIACTPNLDWLLLTKRPENWERRLRGAAVYLQGSQDGHTNDPAWCIINQWLPWNGVHRFSPPANIWLGTTVEDQQRADQRIPALLSIPSKVRFLSCEPLLGPVDLNFGNPKWRTAESYHAEIHWVICGGESGPQARPMHPDWARSLRDQCQAAGVPFLFKQWGEWAPAVEAHGTTGHVMQEGTGDRYRWIGWDGKTQNPSFHGLRDPIMAIAKVGKHTAGRLLDGHEHNAFPPSAT